jgi:uncharacterized protein
MRASHIPHVNVSYSIKSLFSLLDAFYAAAVTTLLAIIATVMVTSLLSGVLGMAGGMILMAVLVTLQPMATAMVVHGLVQAVANGSRTLFLLRHVHWALLLPYLVGASIALAAFATVALVPDPALVLIVIGAFPWLARVTSRLARLDITQPATAVGAGIVVTGTQLFAGVSGPLLDVFYLNAKLNRYQVIASKAITQTVGHLMKLAYYGVLIGHDQVLPAWFLIAAVAAAIVGTGVGTRLVALVSDGHFRRVTGWVILALGALCVAEGVRSLWPVLG